MKILYYKSTQRLLMIVFQCYRYLFLVKNGEIKDLAKEKNIEKEEIKVMMIKFVNVFGGIHEG